MSKFNKIAGWNKGVQVGIFQKINKIYCMIIREVKVLTLAGLKALEFQSNKNIMPIARNKI